MNKFMIAFYQVAITINLLCLILNLSINPANWYGAGMCFTWVLFCVYFLWRKCRAEELRELQENMSVSVSVSGNDGVVLDTSTLTCQSACGKVQIKQPDTFTTNIGTNTYHFEKNPPDWQKPDSNPLPPMDDVPPPEEPNPK